MATFVGLGSDIGAVARSCAACCDKGDIASFLAAQQDILQLGAMQEKAEKKAAGGSKGGAPGGKGKPGEDSAFAKLMRAAKEAK